MAMDKVKMKCTMRQMTLYSYLKSGVIFKLNKSKYKFITYTFDFVEGEDEAMKPVDLLVVKDIDSDKYKVIEMASVADDTAEILEE